MAARRQLGRLRTRISAAWAASLVLLLLWTAIGSYLLQRHRIVLDAAREETRNLSHAFEENIRRTVDVVDTAIRAVRAARARDPAHFDLAAWERDSGLTRELTLQISLSNAAGDVVASNLGKVAPGTSIADREHFRVPRARIDDDLFISRPVLGRVSGKWSVQFVRKLYDGEGGFDGVIVGSLDPSFLSRFYSSLDVGHGTLFLAGEDMIVRAAAPESVVALGADLTATTLLRDLHSTILGSVRTRGLDDHIDRIVSWRRVDPYRLVVAVGLSTDDALADFRRDAKACLVIGLGLSLLTLLVSRELDRSRRDLLRSRGVLRAAVENISQGLVVVDATRHLPVLNARAAELLGLSNDTVRALRLVAARPDGAFGCAGLDDPRAAGLRELIEAASAADGVYQHECRRGTVLEIHTKALESGLTVSTFTDITEQRRSAQVLAEARDAAEAGSRARSEFLAVMSHEIRTPLNGVIGAAGLLNEMELGPVQRDYAKLICDSGTHLLTLINDILDFSRLEASRLQLEATPFDPRALVQGSVDLFRAQATIKELHLSAQIEPDVPAAVIGDPGRVRQILLNLVGNAVKFTDQGWVQIGLAAEPDTGGRTRLLFSVADSGIGMKPDAISRMFEEFTQMDGSTSRRFGGSGLGLAICRRLVELMGGEITVTSQPGEGSNFRFCVTLERASAALPAESAAPAPAAEGLTILIAEDNATNRLVATRMLQRLGHQADAVCTGAEAVAALGRRRYDLVLMDVMMPEMDGLTATRRIRALEPAGTHLPVVGLTAASRPEDLAACQAAGMDGVTTKPVTLPALRTAIQEGMRAAAAGSAPCGPDMTTARLAELTDQLGEEAVAEILAAFAEDAETYLDDMREAANAGAADRLCRVAHSLAGAARNVGATALGLRAASLEHDAAMFTAAQLMAELAAMRTDLDAARRDLGLGAAAPARVIEGAA